MSQSFNWQYVLFSQNIDINLLSTHNFLQFSSCMETTQSLLVGYVTCLPGSVAALYHPCMQLQCTLAQVYLPPIHWEMP